MFPLKPYPLTPRQIKHTKPNIGKQADEDRRVGAPATTFTLGLLVCLAVVTAARASDAAQDFPVSANTYRSACREIADRMLDEVFRDPDDWVSRQRKFAAISHAALVQAKLWQWTNRPAYADGANRFLLAVARQRHTIREADFFTVYPFAKAFQILRQRQRLSPGVEAEATEFIRECYRPRDVADHNQALTRACGLALAAQLLPDAERAESWEQYAIEVWSYCTRLGDMTENASNYNRIDAVYLFLLADLLGRTSELRAPSLQAMYARWRDQVSPAGTIPAYGDSGMGPLAPQPDWPRLNAWGEWVAAFERAATFYDDRTFRWAAARLFRRGMQSEPLGRRYFHIEALSALMNAVEWSKEADVAKPLPAPAAGPLLQTRRDHRQLRAWDKLILNPSRAVGSPFVLCNLYPRGHHGHANQHGGVDWYEADSVPLIANLGYNNREPQHTNAFMVHPDDGRGFPHRSPFAANQWQTAELPTDRMPSPPGQPKLRTFKDFGLRVDSSGGVTLWVDNLRLAGPETSVGHESELLEGFESPAGWNFAPHTTGMSRQGDYGLVWQFPPGAETTYKAELRKRLRKFVFDPRRYPRLLLDWKLSDNAEQARPLIVRTGVDFHAHTLQLQPRLTNVHVQANAKGDQLGSLEFNHWFAANVRHQRQLALLREGVLIAVDRVWPTTEVVGRWAGPVWHVGPRQVAAVAAQRRKNRFRIRGASQGLLIAFSRSTPREKRMFGIQSANVWSLEGQKTVFGQQRLTEQPATFVSVLVPCGSCSPDGLPAPDTSDVGPRSDDDSPMRQLQVHGDMRGAVVRIPSGTSPVISHSVTVRISRTGRFEVSRQSSVGAR